MNFFYLLVALAALTLLLFVLSLVQAWQRRRALPYTLSSALFVPEETAFLVVLDDAVGDDYRVFGKVRLSDLVAPRRGTRRRALGQAAARIESLKIDFLVCARASSAMVCAVELVGGKGRRGANKALARACDALGLPLVRVPVAQTYAAKALAEQIYTAMYAPKVTASGAGAKGSQMDDGVSRAEEEQALSVLAAAIREGDALPRARPS